MAERGRQGKGEQGGLWPCEDLALQTHFRLLNPLAFHENTHTHTQFIRNSSITTKQKVRLHYIHTMQWLAVKGLRSFWLLLHSLKSQNKYDHIIHLYFAVRGKKKTTLQLQSCIFLFFNCNFLAHAPILFQCHCEFSSTATRGCFFPYAPLHPFGCLVRPDASGPITASDDEGPQIPEPMTRASTMCVWVRLLLCTEK